MQRNRLLRKRTLPVNAFGTRYRGQEGALMADVDRWRRRAVVPTVLAGALGLVVLPPARAEDDPAPDDAPLVCDEYAGDPDPTSQRVEWQLRDANNVACAAQRQQDATSPAFMSK